MATTTVPAAEVERAIVGAIAPVVGKSMAAASVKGYVARLGAAALDAKQAAQVLAWLAPGLKVFVGAARAAEVVAQAQRALDELFQEKR